MSSLHRLTFASQITGVAGPAAFQRRLAAGLTSRGIEVGYGLDARPGEIAFVVGGTRDLAGLWRAQRRGVIIVQRLDGMNWIHRHRRTGLRHYLRAELNNTLLRWIRDRLAACVVYQSRFARDWWERVYGHAPGRSQVVLNGVPLDLYRPEPGPPLASIPVRLLVVEANLAGGYEVGLEWAAEWAPLVQGLVGAPVTLVVAGRVADRLRVKVAARLAVEWKGLISPDGIPELDRSAHVLFASDVMPACPNSVIEALACGLPVVSFDTGALAELVTGASGRLVPFGGDLWRLDRPDLEALARSTAEIVGDQAVFRAGARARAESGLGVDTMLDGYIAAFGW